MLNQVKNQLKVPILTDVHEPCQVPEAAKVFNMLQLPANDHYQEHLKTTDRKQTSPLLRLIQALLVLCKHNSDRAP